MNNSSKVEAYKSFYQQGKDFFNGGDIVSAREAFLKAAELANDISISSSSINVKTEYHRLAQRILKFVRANCSQKLPVSAQAGSGNSSSDNAVSDMEAEEIADDDVVTFDDVAGLQEVKDQIRFKVIEPAARPELAKLYKISAGAKILLYGPPGTGKTFVAKAIAGEVDAKFFAINCQDLISKYMGDSSKQLEKLFKEAQKHERAIIFFDEFDSVASKREESGNGVDNEMARFVATFLTAVDGFKKSANKMLLLIAATNRPWALDSAMLRGGRFDTQIYVGIPDFEARVFLVKNTLDGLPKDDNVDFYALADALEGFGGGDVVSLCEKIKLEAYKRAIETGSTQNIALADCAKVLSNARNVITKSEMEKFDKYRLGLSEA